MKQVLLVGNPNCGKTTLFNALTGSTQRVGNWPGVTVEKKTGYSTLLNQTVEVTDLPGVYSLSVPAEGTSEDERIAAKAIENLDYDLIINVVDACSLERHLYLTSQLSELGKPLILVLNMMDIAKERGIVIDDQKLSKELNCHVIPFQAHKKIGLDHLQEAISQDLSVAKALHLDLPPSLQSALKHLEEQLNKQQIPIELNPYYARRIMEGGSFSFSERLDLMEMEDQEPDIIFADARYEAIHTLVKKVQSKQSDVSEYLTAKIDKIILNRFLALPLFLSIMYAMFLFAINIGGAFQEFFDLSTSAVFVQGSAFLLEKVHAPHWMLAAIPYGIGKGINTTFTFIPVIAAMFFFLSLLEASGYMARAAFVVDRIMRSLGLPGKSFVPMIVGFGCNVPAILAARTLNSERDRLLTIMMSPFMSCSARLAIYAIFVTAFFPTRGQDIIFSLYLIGILMAVLTGVVLRKSLLPGKPSPLILELPAYHKPSLKRLTKETFFRLRIFIVRASKTIIPVCLILGILNTLSLSGGVSNAAGSDSLLAWIGKKLTILFAPMGIHEDNWPATVGLLTGMLAKEVVVGSLNALYTQPLSALGSDASVLSYDIWNTLQSAFWSIPENIMQLANTILHPLTKIQEISQSSGSMPMYGEMVQRFDGRVGAYAYLLFVLLYLPCVSTVAAIRGESNRKLMWFSVIWSIVVAYFSSVLFYQISTFNSHPIQSLAWICLVLAGMGLTWGFLAYRNSGENFAIKNS